MGRLASLVLVLVFVLSMTLAGCASRDASSQGEGMWVEVNFSDRHRCSRISPEISIYNPPAGTTYYEVRISQRGTPDRYLGGVRWNYGGLNSDNADVIPEGGLGTSYRGPCPNGTGTTSYRFMVYAKSAQDQKLAVAEYVLTLE